MTQGAAAVASKSQSDPYTLPSGGVLHMQRVPFKAAGELRKAITRVFSSAPITAEEMKLTLETIKSAPSMGGGALQRILAVTASDEVERAIFACLQGVARYQPPQSQDQLPVNVELFDHAQHGDAARADQVAIWWRVVEVAVGPFLGTLLSMYKSSLAKNVKSASSPTTATT